MVKTKIKGMNNPRWVKVVKTFMVITLDGNSEIGAHVWGQGSPLELSGHIFLGKLSFNSGRAI